MKLIKKSSGVYRIAATVCMVAIAVNSQTLPTKAQVIAKMKLANDYFMADKANAPCTGCLSGNHSSNIWTRGVYYEGNLSYYAISKDTAALNNAVAWGTFHAWGLNGGNTTTSADNQCAGQSYIDLYRINPVAQRIANIKSCIDAVVSSSSNTAWYWIDAIQMAMPVYAKFGVTENSASYFTKMYALYNYPKTTLGLYNTTDHLWWRDATFTKSKTTAGKNVYWSRGNGWVFAALARVLNELPATDSHMAEYQTTLKDMAAAIKAVQRSDGFWNENLADSTNFGGKETTGTGLFTFGMAWGVNHGLLAKADYLPTIAKAWKAIADSAIHPNGFLGYVQGTGSKPGDMGSATGQPTYNSIPDFDDYGLGCVLLAGSEVAKLADTTTSTIGNSVTPYALPHGGSLEVSPGYLTVTMNKSVPAQLTITDGLGKIVLSRSISGTEKIKLSSSMAAGVYLVRVNRGANVLEYGRFAVAEK
jgi:rhamnogalacturonyl hydrolase YesR